MKIDVTARALVPTRMIAEAAQESSRRALGRMQTHVEDIRVTVTDRQLKTGMVCCEVDIDLARGAAVIGRSVDANPVEAVFRAFDKAARSAFRRLAQEWTRRRTHQYQPMGALQSHTAQAEVSIHQGGAR